MVSNVAVVFFLYTMTISAAWEASLVGKTQNKVGKTVQDSYLLSKERLLALHVASEARPAKTNNAPVHEDANQYNARVLQFCSKVMPQDVCSAAAAKWLNAESKEPKSKPASGRMLRSMSVSIKACSDTKRLGEPLASLGATRLLIAASGDNSAENATKAFEDLALLDLSSAFSSMRGWKVEVL